MQGPADVQMLAICGGRGEGGKGGGGGEEEEGVGAALHGGHLRVGPK